MSHHLDHAIGSDLSYLVTQKRRERGELSLRGLDCTSQPLYAVPTFIVNRRRFIADVEDGTDAANPNSPRIAAGEKS